MQSVARGLASGCRDKRSGMSFWIMLCGAACPWWGACGVSLCWSWQVGTVKPSQIWVWKCCCTRLRAGRAVCGPSGQPGKRWQWLGGGCRGEERGGPSDTGCARTELRVSVGVSERLLGQPVGDWIPLSLSKAAIGHGDRGLLMPGGFARLSFTCISFPRKLTLCR